MIADDHKLVRDGIKMYIEDLDFIHIVAEASNGDEVLKILQTTSIDLIILDINMPGLDGIIVARRVKELYPETKILALTMLTETQYIRQMLRAGVEGYLLKSCTQEELFSAIRAIANGETYYGADITRTVMEGFSPRQKSKSPSRFMPIELTKREKQVLYLITKEYTNQEIAKELFISIRTVEVHKRNLIEKTGAKNIVGLVLYAVEHGFDKL